MNVILLQKRVLDSESETHWEDYAVGSGVFESPTEFRDHLLRLYAAGHYRVVYTYYSGAVLVREFDLIETAAVRMEGWNPEEGA
jgi:hypothetical protein